MLTSWIWAKFLQSLKFEVMSHNNQSGKFFISLADFPWMFLLRILFFIDWIESLKSLSFKLQIHFLVYSVRFFWRSYFTLNTKTHFKIWRHISREPNKVEKQKKGKLKQKDATFIYDPQNLRIRTSITFFFKFPIS